MGNQEKQRRKRKEKQRLLRKARNVSPWEMLGSQPEQCIILGSSSSGAHQVLMVYLQRDGLKTVLSFYIDLWCMGLRDAFGRTGMSDLEVSEYLERAPDLARRICTAEEARKLVAGAIRFGIQNRFRLPPDWQKFARVAGISDWQNADLAGFGKDGKLCYVGSMDELSEKYIGNPDHLLRQDNFDFVSVADDGMTLSSEQVRQMHQQGKILGDVAKERVTPLLEELKTSIIAQGKEPSPLLQSAADCILGAMLTAMAAMDEFDPDFLTEAIDDEINNLRDDFSHSAERKSLEQAIQQLKQSLSNDFSKWLAVSDSVFADPRVLSIVGSLHKED